MAKRKSIPKHVLDGLIKMYGWNPAIMQNVYLGMLIENPFDKYLPYLWPYTVIGGQHDKTNNNWE